MPNTVLGKVSLTPRGAYRSGTRYTALDLVGHEGGGYIALQEVQDIAPSDDGVNWMLLAARGGEGIQGKQGIPGYVFTPSVSAEGVVSWTNSGDLPNPDPIDITGPEGPRGPQGDSVVSIEHTGGTGAPGTTDTYTVKLSNGSIAGTFQVYNGADGNGAGDFKADGSVPMTGNLQMGGNRVAGVGSAQESTDAVNKSDLDKAIQSVTITTDAEPVEGSHNPVQSGGVYSALSNKADNQSAFLDRSKSITGSVLEYALTSDPGLYLVDISATDTPISGIFYYAKIYDVFSGHRIVELYSGASQGYQEIYYNTYNATLSEWKGWVKVATATPPQEYDLPLAEGWNPYQSSAGNQWACTYSKDQFGIVRLCARLTTQNAIAATGTLIATIPAGFRPLKAFSVVCRVQLPGGGSPILTIADVDMYGQIKLLNVEANANSGTVSLVLPPCSFVAAD